jgi:hypothetical protein
MDHTKIGIIQVDFSRKGYPTTFMRQWTASGVAGAATVPEKAVKGQLVDLGTG